MSDIPLIYVYMYGMYSYKVHFYSIHIYIHVFVYLLLYTHSIPKFCITKTYKLDHKVTLLKNAEEKLSQHGK